MLRKLGKKGATALFIITEQRHRLNGAQRPIVAAKLNRFENFFAHTAPTLHYQIYASSTLYLHLDARERFQLARQFLHSAPPSRLGTMISPSNKNRFTADTMGNFVDVELVIVR